VRLTGAANDLQWWYPVADAATLGDAPVALTLMGMPLVLWRDAKGAPVVLDDRCPHRGARLSGEIECPYHGWRFDQSGRCVAVPSQPAFVPSPGHRVRA
jgi:phenylpropionate dioxygenase-like ring-hydroxylating dioxygenase large terminal subunit